jgi:hypothetical protein
MVRPDFGLVRRLDELGHPLEHGVRVGVEADDLGGGELVGLIEGAAVRDGVIRKIWRRSCMVLRRADMAFERAADPCGELVDGLALRIFDLKRRAGLVHHEELQVPRAEQDAGVAFAARQHAGKELIRKLLIVRDPDKRRVAVVGQLLGPGFARLGDGLAGVVDLSPRVEQRFGVVMARELPPVDVGCEFGRFEQSHVRSVPCVEVVRLQAGALSAVPCPLVKRELRNAGRLGG